MTSLNLAVAVSSRVSATSSRSAKVTELANFLRTCDSAELPIAVAFLSGAIRQQGKLGVAYSALRAALKVPAVPAPTLSLSDVDEAFGGLASIKGSGAAARRTQTLNGLFARATAEEQDFLVRLLTGELRQGALVALVIEAIAVASAIDLADVRRAVMMAGGAAGDVAQAALTEGSAALARFSVRLMQPVLPMLSQSASGTDEALRTLGKAAFELKLDGARVQVHKSGDEVRVYTRTLNDVSERVPEIVAAVRAVNTHALILDGEAIALRADGTPLSFQQTMRRFGRKRDIGAMREELPLSAFFFDCLLRDDRILIDATADERFTALEASLPANLIIPRLVTDDAAQAEEFLERALAAGHEGVMAKALDAPYQAGRRGAGWLKIKRANTLDLVVLAAEWGHGRRSGWLSNLHLGARDADGGYVMVGKTFKGLTDEMLKWQTTEFLKRETHRDAMTVYLRPEFVVEIAFNEIQASPRYAGGIALRFARVKAYRTDKQATDADTIETLRDLFAGQIHMRA